MTPTVTYYASGSYGGRVAHIEVSEGTGIFSPRIYGVTIRQANGKEFEPKLSSGGFRSLEEANTYLRELRFSADLIAAAERA